MNEVTVRITPDGSVYLLYQDDCPLFQDLPKKIVRASNVKWDEKRQGWIVLMENCRGGTKQLPRISPRRKDAIFAEIKELNKMLAEGLPVEKLF